MIDRITLSLKVACFSCTSIINHAVWFGFLIWQFWLPYGRLPPSTILWRTREPLPIRGIVATRGEATCGGTTHGEAGNHTEGEGEGKGEEKPLPPGPLLLQKGKKRVK